MRLVAIVPHFEPDVAPTGDVITRIVHELASNGNRLHVITSLPWYENHRVDPVWSGCVVDNEWTDWGRITRLHPLPTRDKANIAARAASFLGFTAMATVAGMAGSEADGVLAMSPPLTLAAAGRATALRRGCPLVLNIQDVYPDVAIDVGVLQGPQVISAFRRLERLSYRWADAVTVLSDDLAETVAPRSDDPTKVHVIPNFVDTGRVRPGPRLTRYRDELGLGSRSVVMYAGNVGYSQPLELMVEAAGRLRDRDDVVFVVNGGGSRLEALERSARGMPNVVFAPRQPADRLSEVIATGDVHVVALRRGLAGASVPSKLYSILAGGRPVLASVDAGSEVARVVDEAGAGVTVPPEDPDAFTEGVLRLLDDAEGARVCGERGRKAAMGWPTPEGIALRYEELFASLAARGRARSGTWSL